MLTAIDIIKIRSALKDQTTPINKHIEAIHKLLGKDQLDLIKRVERIEKYLKIPPIKA